MRKNIFIITVISMLINALSASAADIPIESAPICASEDGITITENLIGDILTEVQNGLGYGEANGKAQAVICKAVIENQTDGFGYADLMSIARNSIFQYRDMYLRPEYYEQTDKNLKLLLSDLITEVENGIKDYDTARKEAHIKILQCADPYFGFETMQGDFCYWDIPAAPGAYFNRARKLLHNAMSRHAQNTQ